MAFRWNSRIIENRHRKRFLGIKKRIVPGVFIIECIPKDKVLIKCTTDYMREYYRFTAIVRGDSQLTTANKEFADDVDYYDLEDFTMCMLVVEHSKYKRIRIRDEIRECIEDANIYNPKVQRSSGGEYMDSAYVDTYKEVEDVIQLHRLMFEDFMKVNSNSGNMNLGHKKILADSVFNWIADNHSPSWALYIAGQLTTLDICKVEICSILELKYKERDIIDAVKEHFED